jgi:hypothetical protein
MQFYPASRCILPLRSKYIPRRSVPTHFLSMFLSLHKTTITGNVHSCVSMFTFQQCSRQDKSLNSTVFFWVMVLYCFACGCRRFGGRIVSNFRAEENDILWIFSSMLDNIPCSFCHIRAEAVLFMNRRLVSLNAVYSRSEDDEACCNTNCHSVCGYTKMSTSNNPSAGAWAVKDVSL